MTETLTERRRRLLREEIGRIAIDLFAERGFDAVTVDDIAEAVGTSQRTFFRYFDSKEAIVLDLQCRLDHRLLAALDAQPQSSGAVTALAGAYRATSFVEPSDRARVLQVAKVLVASPDLRAKAHGARLHGDDELFGRIARRMGVAPSDRRVRVLATTMAAVASVEFARWADTGGRGNPADSIGAALDLVVAGLGSLDRV